MKDRIITKFWRFLLRLGQLLFVEKYLYFLIFKAASRWVTLPRVRVRYFDIQERHFNLLVKDLGFSRENYNAWLDQYFVLNLLQQIWFLQAFDPMMNKVTQYSGVENYEAASTGGKGVILGVIKVGQRKSFWTGYFSKKNDAFPLLKNTRYRLRHLDPEAFRQERIFETFRELREAVKILNQGKSVLIVPEDIVGTQGIDAAFFNARRKFRTTFAELAIQTGARIVPVLATFSENGSITVDYLPQLPQPPAGLSHPEKLRHYIEAFIQVLECQWRNFPGQIFDYRVEKYLEFVGLIKSKELRKKTQ